MCLTLRGRQDQCLDLRPQRFTHSSLLADWIARKSSVDECGLLYAGTPTAADDSVSDEERLWLNHNYVRVAEVWLLDRTKALTA